MLFNDWKKFTNIKASLYHAGQDIYNIGIISLLIIFGNKWVYMILMGLHLLQGQIINSKFTMKINLMAVTSVTKYLVLNIPNHIGEGKY